MNAAPRFSVSSPSIEQLSVGMKQAIKHIRVNHPTVQGLHAQKKAALGEVDIRECDQDGQPFGELLAVVCCERL